MGDLERICIWEVPIVSQFHLFGLRNCNSRGIDFSDQSNVLLGKQKWKRFITKKTSKDVPEKLHRLFCIT